MKTEDYVGIGLLGAAAFFLLKLNKPLSTAADVVDRPLQQIKQAEGLLFGDVKNPAGQPFPTFGAISVVPSIINDFQKLVSAMPVPVQGHYGNIPGGAIVSIDPTSSIQMPDGKVIYSDPGSIPFSTLGSDLIGNVAPTQQETLQNWFDKTVLF